MKINDSKSRRMLIMQQISMRQKSRERQRKSSAERRRKIEQNLNDFMKTMSNISFQQTSGSSRFKYEHLKPSKMENYQELERCKSGLKKQYDQVLRSPSFKDINLARQNESNNRIGSESVNQSNIKNRQYNLNDDQKNKIEDEEILFKEKQKDVLVLTPKPITQNQSSASAIFFTSQFNQFISKNHLSSQQQLEIPQNQSQTNLKQSKFSSQPLNNGHDLNLNQNLLNQDNPNDFQASSQFQNLKYRFSHSNQKDVIAQTKEDKNYVLETHEEQRKQTLIKNKSGHSLALSNQSSLKYSLNQSNIKEILSRKFTNQLIADTIQFDPSQQSDSLYHHVKIQIISEKINQKNSKSFIKDLVLFLKTYSLSKKIMRREKRTYFQAFIIHHQLVFRQKVNEIKCDKFINQNVQRFLKQIFNQLKRSFFTLPRIKVQRAQQMEQQKDKQLKQKIFRCLKIAWYDQKVKKQIELYYLSKLFSHFNSVIKAQKQANRNKSLAFYCLNLKKRYFSHLKQGVYNLQNERIQRDNAVWHYSFRLQGKVFEAWKEKLSYKDRYISLAMTTKNTFKQTGDQKWLQIKTVDFRQIK